MTPEARLIGECRTALKIAIGSLRGLNDVLPTATASETIGELQAVVDKIDAWSYSRLETKPAPHEHEWRPMPHGGIGDYEHCDCGARREQP